MATDIRERVAEVIASASTDWQYEWCEYREGRAADPGPNADYITEHLLEAFPQLAEEPEWDYRARVEIVSDDAPAKLRGWHIGVHYISQSTPFSQEQMDTPELYEGDEALNLLEGCRLVEQERRRRASAWEVVE